MTAYYLEFVDHEGLRQPLALYRRDVRNNVNVDRIYTKDGDWLPTGEIAVWSLGLGDLDIAQVDQPAAQAFMEKVKSGFAAWPNPDSERD
jgi:hypothetical protein